jgi:hypothetical protein
MTDFSYALGVQPKWYLPDNSGKPTAGFLYTFNSLNPTEYKPVYSDPSNSNAPYPQPVPFAMNGTAGPLYFQFDADNPDELYYLRVFDENMNFLYDINNYNGGTGGGGGSVTTAANLKNYAGNNIYEYNIGSTAGLGASIPNNTVLAPSNHMNFIDPDIRFINGTVGGTDIITFPEFTLGSNPLNSDVTPQYYLEYKCTAGGSETSKYIQFPIQPKVTTLDQQVITVTLWARCISGSDQITVRTRQFFGTPTPLVTPTADNFHAIGSSITLSNSWVKYSVTGTIPGVSTATLSPTGDDALYLTIELPHGLTTVIDIVKVSMYLGSAAPPSDFNSFQQIEGLIETPRTGDLKSGMQYATYIPKGWIPFDSGGLGDELSQAGHNNSNTPNVWFLFNMIWNNTTNSQCQLHSQGPAYTPIPRGVSAQADWEAHTVLSMPNNLGSVIANIGLGHVTGESGGSETVTLTGAQLGAHTHPATTSLGAPNGQLAWDNNSLAANSFNYTPTTGRLHISGNIAATTTVSVNTGGQAHNNIQPTTYIPYIIKL